MYLQRRHGWGVYIHGVLIKFASVCVVTGAFECGVPIFVWVLINVIIKIGVYIHGANSMVPIFAPTEDETMKKPDSCLGASRCCMHVTTYMIVQNLFCMIVPFVMLSCRICPHETRDIRDLVGLQFQGVVAPII